MGLVLLLGACQTPHPRTTAPNVVKKFVGDYQAVATCINDQIEQINPASARLTWRPTENKAEVMFLQGGIIGGGRILTSYVVAETAPNEMVVEYRSIKTLWNDLDETDEGWKRVLRCTGEEASR